MTTEFKPGDIVTVTGMPTSRKRGDPAWTTEKNKYIDELCIVEETYGSGEILRLKKLGTLESWLFPIRVVKKL